MTVGLRKLIVPNFKTSFNRWIIGSTGGSAASWLFVLNLPQDIAGEKFGKNVGKMSPE